MKLSFLGATINEFDIGATDFILFLFCLYFLCQLLHYKVKIDVLSIYIGLTSSSLLGSFFHFFFPLKDKTTLGFLVWFLVAFSIGLVIFGVVHYCMRTFLAYKKIYRIVPVTYV